MRGHVRRHCPNGDKAQSQCGKTHSKANVAPEVSAGARPKKASTEQKESTQGLYLDMRVCNVTVCSVVDTGSQMTLVDHGLWEQMQPTPTMDTRHKIPLRAANGEVLQTYGLCTVSIEIAGEMIRADAIVADIPGEKVIAGMDLLTHLDCVIYVAEKMLYIRKHGVSVDLHSSQSVQVTEG